LPISPIKIFGLLQEMLLLSCEFLFGHETFGKLSPIFLTLNLNFLVKWLPLYAL
jgi:hypothetical protein